MIMKDDIISELIRKDAPSNLSIPFKPITQKRCILSKMAMSNEMLTSYYGWLSA